jgi:hypothetical protein
MPLLSKTSVIWSNSASNCKIFTWTNLAHGRASYVPHSGKDPSSIYVVKNVVDIKYRDKHQWSPELEKQSLPAGIPCHAHSESSSGYCCYVHTTSCKLDLMAIIVRQITMKKIGLVLKLDGSGKPLVPVLVNCIEIGVVVEYVCTFSDKHRSLCSWCPDIIGQVIKCHEHIHYAKWIPVHLKIMTELSGRHPEVFRIQNV